MSYLNYKDFLREYYEYALLFSKDDKEIEKKL